MIDKIDKELDELRKEIIIGALRRKTKTKIEKLKQRIKEIEYEIILLETKI